MVKQLVLAAGMLAAVGNGDMQADAGRLPLAGTWVMESAYEILADGRRVTNYGEHPLGLLIVAAEGRYSLQIFRRDRPAFAAGDKAADELRAARAGIEHSFRPGPYRSGRAPAHIRHRRRFLPELGGPAAGARLCL